MPTGEGQELSTYDKVTKRYRKFIVKDDILVGMIMVGDIDGAGILTAMIKQKTKVSLDTLNYWLNHPVRFQGYCTAEAKGGIVCGIC